MSSGGRAGLIAAAIAVAVAAFLVLRPGDEDDDSPVDTVATETATTAGPAQAEPRAQPRFETVTIAAGAVEGGQREIEVERGETVRLEVRSDAADTVHVHGYDLERPVAPGRPARFRFEAGIEGVFEVEAHDLGHAVIAKLVVRP